MPVSVQIGAILIQEGLLLPEALTLETESYSASWRLVKALDCVHLDRRINAVEWNFFFSGRKAEAMAFGSGEKSIRRAVSRTLAKVRSQHFNCAEITDIARRHFLGIPYIVVSAHPHHIQPSGFLQNNDDRRQAQRHSDRALG